MTRTAALTYVGGLYSQQLVEAGLIATDTDANLKPVLDDALTILGVAYDDMATAEVTGDDIRGYRVLLRYFGLDRIYSQIMHRVNISGGNPSASKSAGDYPKEVRARLESLRKEAADFGLAIGPTWQAPTSINTDYLEPMVTW